MRSAIASLLAAPLLLGAVPGFAQSGPSPDQIVKALKPSGEIPKADRGIRVTPPGGDQAPSVDLTVEFATGSAALTPQARDILGRLGQALTSQDLAQYRFRIEGHTDTVGSTQLNMTLSQRRAEAVATYLEQTFSIAPARLDPVGMGEEGLAVPTPPQTPNAHNRRVKVVNLGA